MEVYKIWPDKKMPLDMECNQTPMLEPYHTDSEEPSPCIIILPGGGYKHLAYDEGAPVARWLQGIGITGMVLNYRVSPYRHPAPLQDIQRAIRYIRAHAEELHVDPNRVGVLGFSAGAHLAAVAETIYDEGDPRSEDMVERMSSRPDVAVLCYPPIDLGTLGFRLDGLLDEGENYDAMVDLLSPNRHVNKDTPPTFIWHTGEDECVPVMQAVEYAKELVSNKVECEFHLYAKGPHGRGLAEGYKALSTWTKLCEHWLREQGF